MPLPTHSPTPFPPNYGGGWRPPPPSQHGPNRGGSHHYPQRNDQPFRKRGDFHRPPHPGGNRGGGGGFRSHQQQRSNSSTHFYRENSYKPPSSSQDASSHHPHHRHKRPHGFSWSNQQQKKFFRPNPSQIHREKLEDVEESEIFAKLLHFFASCSYNNYKLSVLFGDLENWFTKQKVNLPVRSWAILQTTADCRFKESVRFSKYESFLNSCQSLPPTPDISVTHSRYVEIEETLSHTTDAIGSTFARNVRRFTAHLLPKWKRGRRGGGAALGGCLGGKGAVAAANRVSQEGLINERDDEEGNIVWESMHTIIELGDMTLYQPGDVDTHAKIVRFEEKEHYRKLFEDYLVADQLQILSEDTLPPELLKVSEQTTRKAGEEEEEERIKREKEQTNHAHEQAKRNAHQFETQNTHTQHTLSNPPPPLSGEKPPENDKAHTSFPTKTLYLASRALKQIDEYEYVHKSLPHLPVYTVAFTETYRMPLTVSTPPISTLLRSAESIAALKQELQATAEDEVFLSVKLFPPVDTFQRQITKYHRGEKGALKLLVAQILHFITSISKALSSPSSSADFDEFTPQVPIPRGGGDAEKLSEELKGPGGTLKLPLGLEAASANARKRDEKERDEKEREERAATFISSSVVGRRGGGEGDSAASLGGNELGKKTSSSSFISNLTSSTTARAASQCELLPPSGEESAANEAAKPSASRVLFSSNEKQGGEQREKLPEYSQEHHQLQPLPHTPHQPPPYHFPNYLNDLSAAAERHYNRKKQIRLQGSVIQCLRQHNNFIKLKLIRLYVLPRANIIDLACGHAQDIFKYIPIKPLRYLGIDIAGNEIEEARSRVKRTFYSPPFPIEFRVGNILRPDCFYNLKPRSFGVVTIQLALHYMMASKEQAEGFLRRVFWLLKPGGVFIGSVSDCDTIARCLEEPYNELLTKLKGREGGLYEGRVYGGGIGRAVGAAARDLSGDGSVNVVVGGSGGKKKLGELGRAEEEEEEQGEEEKAMRREYSELEASQKLLEESLAKLTAAIKEKTRGLEELNRRFKKGGGGKWGNEGGQGGTPTTAATEGGAENPPPSRQVVDADSEERLNGGSGSMLAMEDHLHASPHIGETLEEAEKTSSEAENHGIPTYTPAHTGADRKTLKKPLPSSSQGEYPPSLKATQLSDSEENGEEPPKDTSSVCEESENTHSLSLSMTVSSSQPPAAYAAQKEEFSKQIRELKMQHNEKIQARQNTQKKMKELLSSLQPKDSSKTHRRKQLHTHDTRSNASPSTTPSKQTYIQGGDSMLMLNAVGGNEDGNTHSQHQLKFGNSIYNVTLSPETLLKVVEDAESLASVASSSAEHYMGGGGGGHSAAGGSSTGTTNNPPSSKPPSSPPSKKDILSQCFRKNWGYAYTFWLEEAISSLIEYNVPWDSFCDLAVNTVGFKKKVFSANFESFWKQKMEKVDLSEKMASLKPLSAEELEVFRFYKVFVFKRPSIEVLERS